MLFNTLPFFLFLPVVFVLHWFVFGKSGKWQNVLLLVASYYFYACWDYRFLLLLVFSTALDFFSGLRIQAAATERARKAWLYASIGINLGFLAVFKYYNFFVTSLVEAVGHLGIHVNVWTFKILLPVGISFYTFHGISYVIDVYKRRVLPTTKVLDYALFVSYFPLLVAGPIERATHLLPQLESKREFNYAKAIDGLRQALWGLFKKVVVADNLASFVHFYFTSPASHSSYELLLGIVFFTVQIYCDFSGYSDIAIGVSKLFGIDLMENFRYPYFARSIREGWTKWHISLTSWLRDYVYPALWSPRRRMWVVALNTFVLMLIVGLWHGANWTFLAWGLVHGFYLAVPILFPALRVKHKAASTLKDLPYMVFTFSLSAFSLVLFRSTDLHNAYNYYTGLFCNWSGKMPAYGHLKYLAVVAFMFAVEWKMRNRNHGLDGFFVNAIARRIFYFVLFWLVLYNLGNEHDFIYFQF